MYGGNDMERGYVDLRESMDPYYEEFGEVIDKFRAGKPGLSCLVMSVTDHGKRLADGQIVSKPFGRILADAQGEVARRKGCAFFDSHAAMGGEGAVGRWYRSSPRLISPDLGHPNSLGHEVIAGLLTDALLHGYETYRERMAGESLPELSDGPEGGSAEEDSEEGAQGKAGASPDE
jgi:lysophospholipase L1-like esterase